MPRSDRDYIWVDDFTKVRREDCIHCVRCGDLLIPGDEYHDLDGEVLCPDCWDELGAKTTKVVGE